MPDESTSPSETPSPNAGESGSAGGAGTGSAGTGSAGTGSAGTGSAGTGSGGTGAAGGGAGAGSGLEENVAGALSYLMGPVTGIIFLILDKDRPFVRFHAMQCLVVTIAWLALSLALMVLGAILGMIPVLGWIITTLAYIALSLVGFGLWLVLMYKAFEGEEWEVPVLGEYARRYEAKV